MILLPTLNRIGLLRDFIRSYIETEAVVPVLVLVDDNDYIANQDDYETIKARMPAEFRFCQTGQFVSMGDKVRYIWPEVKGLSPTWVGILNDDHYCVTKNWDKRVDAFIDGTNMVSTNDGGWNFGFRVVGLTAWSMPLLETAGFPIFPPDIDHWFIDDIWKSIGESSGCWLETIKVNIEHRHVFIGKMPEDATSKISQSRDKAAVAQAAFKQFMEKDFQDVCLRIVKLREDKIFGEKFT